MTRRERRLSAEDWAQAALEALRTDGLAAVAVEPLARRLDTTKGSFYWHYKNRDALIEAAMRRWEEIGTERIIAAARTEPDVAARLRHVIEDVMERGATGRIELSLMSSIDHPAIGPALARIAERRIGYIAEQLTALDVPAAEARRRAVIAVSVYHGFNQLAHAAPGSLPEDSTSRRELISDTVDLLLAGHAGPSEHGG